MLSYPSFKLKGFKKKNVEHELNPKWFRAEAPVWQHSSTAVELISGGEIKAGCGIINFRVQLKSFQS